TRNGVAGVHQRFYSSQSLPELASGMQICEVLFLESAFFCQRHRQRVTKREHRCRRSCRRQAKAACLTCHGTVERNVSSASERGSVSFRGRRLPRRFRRNLIASHCDNWNLQPFERRQQPQDFFRLATRGKRQHYVPAHYHAKIAVDRLHWVHKQCRRSRRTQSGGNLPGDNSTLAHASHDHAPGAAIDHFHRAIERLRHRSGNTICQSAQCFRLNAHHVFTDVIHERSDVSTQEARSIQHSDLKCVHGHGPC